MLAGTLMCPRHGMEKELPVRVPRKPRQRRGNVVDLKTFDDEQMLRGLVAALEHIRDSGSVAVTDDDALCEGVVRVLHLIREAA